MTQAWWPSADALLSDSAAHAPLLVAIGVLCVTYLALKAATRGSGSGEASKCPFFAGARAGSAQAGKQHGSAPPAPAAAPAPKSMTTAGEPGSAEGPLRLTKAQLAAHDGSDPGAPLYIAVRGAIYDVSAGRSFYGPGGPYAVFAGKECARALAFMKVTAEDCSDDLAGASPAQLATLADWEAKFRAKYGVAGRVVE